MCIASCRDVHRKKRRFRIGKVLGGLADRDPMDFVAVEGGGVAKGTWGEDEEGGDGAGGMDEEDAGDGDVDESMEVRESAVRHYIRYCTIL